MDMSVEAAGNDGPETGELSAADAARLNDAKKQIGEELGKVIVGQQNVIDEIMIGQFSRVGNCLPLATPWT